MPGPSRIEIPSRLLALGIGFVLALTFGSAAFGWWALQRPGSVTRADLLKDPTVRRNLMAELSRQSKGNFDSHPDAAVGHVHLPGERDGYHKHEVVGERGMREKDYVLPKPPGLLRIVVLGDSFAFGWRIEAEERLGSRLLAHMREHGAGAAEIEVLHLAVCSWSIANECTYVRRQLEELQPDLLVQVTVQNDLDDPQGVRGFGSLGTFSTQGPGLGDALLCLNHPMNVLGTNRQNFIHRAWGLESQQRFRHALDSIQELRADLALFPHPAPHLLVVHWAHENRTFHANLGRYLEPESILYLPNEFWAREELRVAPDDFHWNAQGHEEVARVLYAAVRARNLLPTLPLEPWPEAEEMGSALIRTGWDEAQEPPAPPRGIASKLHFPEPNEKATSQILGGLDSDGLASPYASIVLSLPGQARRFEARGSFFPDRVLGGNEIHVFLDELEVQTLTVEPGGSFAIDLELPEELRQREALGINFVTDDFVYRGADLRKCVAFRLEHVELR